MRISKISMLMSMFVVTTLTVPAIPAQFPGTYQVTLDTSCTVLCSFLFPETANRILMVDQVNCGLMAYSTKPMEAVRMWAGGNSGEIWFEPRFVSTKSYQNRYVLNERLQFQVPPKSTIIIATTMANSPSAPQTCTVMGHYL